MFLQWRLPQCSSKPELGLNTLILREELSHELFLIILFSWCDYKSCFVESKSCQEIQNRHVHRLTWWINNPKRICIVLIELWIILVCPGLIHQHLSDQQEPQHFWNKFNSAIVLYKLYLYALLFFCANKYKISKHNPTSYLMNNFITGLITQASILWNIESSFPNLPIKPLVPQRV